MKTSNKVFLFFISLSFMITFAVVSCSKEDVQKGTNVEQQAEPQFTVDETINIANVNEQMYFTEAQLLDAFNGFEGNQYTATAAVVSYDGSTYKLLYIIGDGELGFSYDLEISGDDLVLGVGIIATHTCTGDPCNSCELVWGPFITTHCKCNQGCTGCKCNHTVTYGQGSYPSIPDAQELVGRLL